MPRKTVSAPDVAAARRVVEAVRAYLRGTCRSDDAALRGRLVSALGDYDDRFGGG